MNQVKCNDCLLTNHHVHCATCSHELPSRIVYLENREPTMGDSLRIIPGNYVVMCPGCGEGVLVRIKGKS